MKWRMIVGALALISSPAWAGNPCRQRNDAAGLDSRILSNNDYPELDYKQAIDSSIFQRTGRSSRKSW